eukprot:gnl/MRDRNA2_/MRDRNA2_100099_c0_seq1.p1 gnl/MRDRNA2_/MRDRNA2_100099_c0~~gnl/MRDRNA2_/MRDRNA2_100099_c0_seq1.p1  ORF type:complete len:483 (+),score=77.56 gnl/MRDRNA2_/MRDRNA2_100099_c0_seq1:60-1508(+)
MLRRVTIVILHALGIHCHGNDVLANRISGIVQLLTYRLFDRAFKVAPHHFSELENITLGKHGYPTRHQIGAFPVNPPSNLYRSSSLLRALRYSSTQSDDSLTPASHHFGHLCRDAKTRFRMLLAADHCFGIGLGIGGLGLGIGLSQSHRVSQRPQFTRKATTGRAVQTAQYSLIASATMLPHPEKEKGEDACFVRVNEQGGGIIGVADGVGGYNDLGIDPGNYARMLSFHASEAHDSGLHPKALMAVAQNETVLMGAATLCIVEVNSDKLRAANVGDSGFRVIRGGKIVLASPSLQHSFNYPYQLSCKDICRNTDTAEDADTFDFPVQHGDLVVAGTDGLFDNVFDHDIAQVATEASRFEITALAATKAASNALVKLARKNAVNKFYKSPFAVELERASDGKVKIQGGKLDDITVVVGKVVSTADAATDLKNAAAESERVAKSTRANLQQEMDAQAKQKESMDEALCVISDGTENFFKQSGP